LVHLTTIHFLILVIPKAVKRSKEEDAKEKKKRLGIALKLMRNMGKVEESKSKMEELSEKLQKSQNSSTNSIRELLNL